MDYLRLFQQRVKDTIDQNNMVASGDRILVALSGGIDSVVLLDVLVNLQEVYRFSLEVVHVNHNLRGEESGDDADFSEAVAGRYKLRFQQFSVDVLKTKIQQKLSLEEAARFHRYEIFERFLRGGGVNKIALGHNKNDSAETVLMKMIRGAGVYLTAGILPVRDHYIRPLIQMKRSEIIRYSEKANLKFQFDSSNDDVDFLRNRVRKNLIPLIESDYNPNIVDTLDSISHMVQLQNLYFQKKMKSLFVASNFIKLSRKFVCFKKNIVDNLDEVLKYHLLVTILQYLGVKQPKLIHLRMVLAVLKSEKPNQRLALAQGIVLKKEYDLLTFDREKLKEKKDFCYQLDIPGKIFIEEIKLQFVVEEYTYSDELFHQKMKEENTECFDASIITEPLMIRNFEQGDLFQPLNMKGHKKLKDLFIDTKIAKSKRSQVPLILHQHEILWIFGIQRSDLGKICSTTQKFIVIHTINNQANEKDEGNIFE